MEDSSAAAQRLLLKADKILASVDEAFIITIRNHKPRLIPAFRPEEISLGRLLGIGGFGIVHEITKFTLDLDVEVDVEREGDCSRHDDNDDNDGDDEDPLGRRGVEGVQTGMTDPIELSLSDTHVHYDFSKARRWMENRCNRNGVARYALKSLQKNLSEVEQARGMVDLAVEAKYLSVVWHPNIIKMRGLAKGNMVDKDFFIILDRLHETLDKRVKKWHNKEKRHKGVAFGLGKNRTVLCQMLVDRMTVAYDLASAFWYLHENKIVYRDIKPQNIGFDIRDDVKIFDFGLCKSLSPHLKAGGDKYGYRLTVRAGSLPYMAPEIVKMETYDSKCDVFSFALLFWEMLSLKQCCKGYTPNQFIDRVVVKNERFPLQKSWPPLIRLLLPEAWDSDPKKRPDMKRVAIMIRGDLNDMTNDANILRRTNHMRDRSTHSDFGDV